MSEAVVVSDKITCPGCHFECKLVKYQCGRGKEFYDLAIAGEEVPERRGPMMTPSEKAASPDGEPPLDNRVMHTCNILSNRLKERHVDVGEDAVVFGLARAGSFMSLPFLAKRTLLSVDELDKCLEEAKQRGLVVVEVEEHAGRIARLTDAGAEQAAIVKAERDKETAEFLSNLTEEEKETLVVLIRKLLGLRS